MEQIQGQVDAGHQPWRLDPVQVATEEDQRYGLDPAAGDRFERVRTVDVGEGSGTGEAYVEVTHGGRRYVVQLIQPNGPGPHSIWTINSIRAIP